MSRFMRHGLGDCTTESHCGCLADAPDQGLAVSTVTPVRTGPNEYAIVIDSDLSEHPVHLIGTPDQLMQLAGQITTAARAIKSKEYKP